MIGVNLKQHPDNILGNQTSEGPQKADHSSEETVVRIRNLNIYYGDFLAVRDITMDVCHQKITAIIGPSGCGKSTLLRSINRMNELVPTARTEGDVIFCGQNIYQPGLNPVQIRSRIGMVFQRPNPFPKSIYENIAWGARVNGLKEGLENVVERSLRKAGLWDEVKDKLHQNGLYLSGGQQQRLCIARAIAVEPEIILMDEPCSALDPVATLKIEDLMRELAVNYTIVIVTHNMQQAARVSDYTAMMMINEDRAGTMIEFDETDKIFTRPKDKRTEDYVTGRFG